MNQENISLKDALLGALLQWRRILIISFAVAVVFGAVNLVLQYRGRSAAEQKYQNAMEEYQAAVAEQDNQIAYIDQKITKLENKLDSLREYSEKSILLKIDPKKKATASADYLVQMKDLEPVNGINGILYDPADSALLAYAYNITTMIDWEELSVISGEEEKYLHEIVELYRNAEANVFTVYVNYFDQNVALEMLRSIEDTIESRQPEINKTVGEHSLVLVTEGVRWTTDTALETTQTNLTTSIKNCEKELTETQDQREAIKSVEKPQKEFRIRRILLRSILLAIIGFILGMCGSLYCFMLRYIQNGKIHSSVELETLHDIKNLAGLDMVRFISQRHTFIDRLLYRGLGFDMESDKDKLVHMAALRINENVTAGNQIFLTGHVNEQDMEDLYQAISKYAETWTPSFGLNADKDPETYEKMLGAQKVVFVERAGSGTYQMLDKECALAMEADKKIIGCIIL